MVVVLRQPALADPRGRRLVALTSGAGRDQRQGAGTIVSPVACHHRGVVGRPFLRGVVAVRQSSIASSSMVG